MNLERHCTLHPIPIPLAHTIPNVDVISKAMDRGGTSDPYVKIHVADDLIKAKKTTVKNKTLNPTWMENFEFHIQGSNRREALNIEVRTHIRGGQFDVIRSAY